MVREGLLGDLHATIERAKLDNVPVRKEGVRVRTNDHFQEINLQVIPITEMASGVRHLVVLFEEAPRSADATPAVVLRREPEGVKEDAAKDQEIIRLKQELEATKAYLQSVIELKDVGNEELRAANEEIISANEELQSTNEELTTTKEELQASNEELSTVNEELQNRIRVANQLGDDMVNLIESTNIPLVVLGTDLCIRRYTPSAERVLNLRGGDLGRPVGDLKLKIDVPDLETLAREVIGNLEIKQREITDTDGVWHKLYIRPYKTLDHVIGGVVLMLIDIDAIKHRERQLQESRDYALSIVETVREPLVVLDGRFHVRTANRSFYQTFQLAPTETEDRLIYELDNGQWNIPRLRVFFENVLPRSDHAEDFELEHEFPRIGPRTILLNAQRVVQIGSEPAELILLAIEDITVRKQAEHEISRLAAIVEYSDDAIIGQTIDFIITSWNEGSECMFGYPAGEAVGHSMLMLVPPDQVEDLRQIHERIRDGERFPTFRTRRIRKGGDEITVAVTHSPIKDNTGKIIGISAIDRDVTEQAHAEEELRTTRDRLAADLASMARLHEVSTRLVQEGDLQSLLEEIVEAAITLTAMDMGALQLYDPVSNQLTITAQHGIAQRFLDEFGRLDHPPSAFTLAQERGERVIVEDIGSSPIFADNPIREVMLEAGMIGLQSTPLFSRSGRLVGMFSTYSRVPHKPAERDLWLLDLLARARRRTRSNGPSPRRRSRPASRGCGPSSRPPSTPSSRSTSKGSSPRSIPRPKRSLATPPTS